MVQLELRPKRLIGGQTYQARTGTLDSFFRLGFQHGNRRAPDSCSNQVAGLSYTIEQYPFTANTSSNTEALRAKFCCY